MRINDSLKSRYLFKLLASVVGFGISMIIQSLVSRGLGPGNFGNYSFLTSTFTQLLILADLGNTSGFFVKLSQRQKDFKIISFYFYFTFIAISIIIFSILLLSQTELLFAFFPGQELKYIFLALFLGVVARILQVLNNISDAFGLTIKSETGLLIQKIISVVFVSALFFSAQLTLTTYFVFQYIVTFVLILMLLFIIKSRSIFNRRHWSLSNTELKEYISEFYIYSRPLFFGFVFGYGSAIFDRWLLQYFSGSIEQGFYGLAFQISSVSTIFGAAMSLLIMREFSIAFRERAFDRMAEMFDRYIPLLYSLTAFIACYIVINAQQLILFMGGDKYSGAYLAVIIMSFYPIHNIYGQLSGSLFLATDQTSLYSKLNILNVVFSLPLLLLLISPNSVGGFDMGSAGLASKMVISQILLVNVQLYYNAKLLKLNFYRYLSHQLICVISLLSIAVTTYYIVGGLLPKINPVPAFFIGGVIYTLLSTIAAYIKPDLFGLRRTDFEEARNYATLFLKKQF